LPEPDPEAVKRDAASRAAAEAQRAAEWASQITAMDAFYRGFREGARR
jgi:hypothetical protein